MRGHQERRDRDQTENDIAIEAAELPTLRAIAAADLHNLVFQLDYRIVPAITRVQSRPV